MDSRRDSVFTDTVQEGVNRVMNRKNYAFLAESTMAEYLISQNCKNLTQIGGLLNSRGYGIGTKQGKLTYLKTIEQNKTHKQMLCSKNSPANAFCIIHYGATFNPTYSLLEIVKYFAHGKP